MSDLPELKARRLHKLNVTTKLFCHNRLLFHSLKTSKSTVLNSATLNVAGKVISWLHVIYIDNLSKQSIGKYPKSYIGHNLAIFTSVIKRELVNNHGLVVLINNRADIRQLRPVCPWSRQFCPSGSRQRTIVGRWLCIYVCS